ncbi:MAG: metal ABC transporter ATP-binding protein [Bradymonadia bacterium]
MNTAAVPLNTSTTREKPLIHCSGLQVGYRGRAILPSVDLSIEQGQIWAFIGRNGGGKSTLLRTLLGLQPKIAGTLQCPACPVSYVSQRGTFDTSVPARAIDVVMAGMDRRWSFLRPRLGRGRSAALHALEEVGLPQVARQSFSELSEGQKQRVLMAQALVSEPSLLVLDEPTSAMDVEAERSIFELIAHLVKRHRFAVLIASHQLSFVPEFSSHVALLDRETGVAITGDTTTVMASEIFQSRYGTLIPRSPVDNDPLGLAAHHCDTPAPRNAH